jgi:hypothetical protein
MTAIVLAFSRALLATNAECESAFPVLMFTATALVLLLCLVVASGAPPFAATETF